MLSGKIKLLYNDEILDEYFEFLLRSKTLEVFQKTLVNIPSQIKRLYYS